ncbi:L,D-transpeptidase family protein [Embleya sp. NPDC005575]|uniref:L,D-transpeptidase family protein n=1 Tax=Embleya sp. NPDC005575 TaxID=3156892 RepID=UPI0033AF3411
MTISRRSLFRTAPIALALIAVPTARNALAAGSGPGDDAGAVAGTATGTTADPNAVPIPDQPPMPAPVPTGIGPRWATEIPAATTQLLLVVGEHPDSDRATASFWTRGPSGWRSEGSRPARNGRLGWTPDHHEGDLRSPIGVFTLTDAGGLRPDPGTRLSYDRSDDFAIDGTGLAGEPLAGTFDHVIAIDYNRVRGTSPLDPTRPRGEEFGGGIWLHIDHGGPTHGCVTLPAEALPELLRALDPAAHPVVVMGDAPTLALGGPAS